MKNEVKLPIDKPYCPLLINGKTVKAFYNHL